MAIKSIKVDRVLKQLGSDMKDARRRRLYSTEDMAKRAGISRPTLKKIEEGDPGVSLGNYAAVLLALGKVEKLGSIFGEDWAGIAVLEHKKIPKRIKSKTAALEKLKKNNPLSQK